jgi:17beta-estradiol 17-dehydrogenase / very-long-chain 3-oxoacyl-CoA reductase
LAILQNNLGLLKLTRVVVPHLLASNKATRTQSLILNIGSLGGTIPSPYLAAYSASKAFLSTFNDCLARELAPLGVVVQLVIPGFVVSKMSKIRRSSALVPNPAQFVKSALGSIGLARGAQGRANESTPWWTHALLDYVVAKTGALNLAVWYNGRE